MTRTKISLHVMAGGELRGSEYLQRTRAPLIFLNTPLGDWISDYLTLPYKPLIISKDKEILQYGAPFSPEEVSKYIVPEVAAMNFFNANVIKWLSQKQASHVDAWVMVNEIATPGWSGLGEDALYNIRWTARYLTRLVNICTEHKIKGVFGNFSVGTPDLPEHNRLLILQEFLPFLRAIEKNGGYLGLHEYFGFDRSWDGWLAFRYRWWLKLAWMHGINLKIIITENGLDNLPDGSKPYRELLQKSEYSKYVDLLQFYDNEIQKVPEIVGTAVFTAGSGYSPDWNNHDITIDDAMVFYLMKERFKYMVDTINYTHIVTTGINIRKTPYFKPDIPTGDKVGSYKSGTMIKVLFEVNYAGRTWACLSETGDRWVDSKFLKRIT